MSIIEVGIPIRFNIRPCQPTKPPSFPSKAPKTRPISISKSNAWITKASKLGGIETSSDCTSASLNQAASGQLLQKLEKNNTNRKRVFFLDVNPLCYAGSRPSLQSFAHWVSLFFHEVSRTDPVIAVLDGEGGSEHRRELLPSYKAHRIKFLKQPSVLQKPLKGSFGSSHRAITDVLRKCNVPVIKIEGHEADDVVATLVEQALQREFRVVIASPDKDFKQLISEDVQIVMPLTELNRWSFYTLRHYLAQYKCDPRSDLSLRCIVGDEVDGVPGIQHVAPGFGRKTALKLLKKYGSLENLLNTAAVRTVGRQYAQDALVKYANYLRTNYKVLALRRDVDVQIQEEWLVERDSSNDSTILSNFMKFLEGTHRTSHQDGSAKFGRRGRKEPRTEKLSKLCSHHIRLRSSHDKVTGHSSTTKSLDVGFRLQYLFLTSRIAQ